MTEEYGLSYPLDRVDWIEGTTWRPCEGSLQRAKEALFEENDFGAFLSNTRYITSTYNPLWTTGSSGLRYAMLCRDADQPILYEQGDIGYHTRRLAPWLDDENVKYAITGMGWISRTMGERAHEQQVGKFVDQIVEDLKRHGVLNQVLATDFYDPFVMAALEKKGVKCSGEGGLVLMMARRLKMPDEVQCIRTTTTIGDAMFLALVRILRPGVSEGEILGEMMRECYRLGGEVVSGCLLTSGPTHGPTGGSTTAMWCSPTCSTPRGTAIRPVLSHVLRRRAPKGHEGGVQALTGLALRRHRHHQAGRHHQGDRREVAARPLDLGRHRRHQRGHDRRQPLGARHRALPVRAAPHLARDLFGPPHDHREGNDFAIETQDGDGEGQGSASRRWST